jgi:hypothetical protein
MIAVSIANLTYHGKIGRNIEYNNNNNQSWLYIKLAIDNI